MKKDLVNLSPNFKWDGLTTIEEGAIMSTAFIVSVSKILSGIPPLFFFLKRFNFIVILIVLAAPQGNSRFQPV